MITQLKLAINDTPLIHLSSPSGATISGTVHNAINFLIYIAGIISVIFVLVGAFMYVTSGGNPQNTKKAKDTILYALVGLVITIVAFSAVQFVVGQLR